MAKSKELPSGMWRNLVRVKGHAPVSVTRESKRACDEAATQIRADLLSGKTGFPHKTLSDALTRYAEEVSPTKAGAKWEIIRLDNFREQFTKLGKFGDVAHDMWLSEIDTPHIAAWRDARLKVISEGSVKREIDLLRNVFTIARREWKWTGTNVFEGIRLPKDNPPRTRTAVWPEIRRIVRDLGYKTGEAPENKSQEIAYMFLLALRTALRDSELRRLTDENVDLETRVARIKRKTFHLTREVRHVPFTSAAARLFRPLKGWGGPLFTVQAGSRDTLFRKTLTRTMIDGLQFRDSRATAATFLARSKRFKVDVLTLAKILDHKDLDQLNRTYYRETPADMAKRIG